MAIPQSFIQDLLTRVDVVEVVGRHVQLKKGGANFMGLCPFHSEKSPSFTVSPTKQFYHCFGCGKNGNAIGFLMDHTGANFVEAVKDLAQQVGMQVPEDDRDPADRERAAQAREKQATLTTVLEKAGSAFRKYLRETPRAVDYLKGRGLSGDIAKAFGLGYAPEGWRTLASVFPDYDDALLVESGLVISHEAQDGAPAKKYDRFRDRIMFPIRNVKGECIGFGGRVLDKGEPKYLNSPETPVFSKGRELYGLFEARQALREHGFVLVTEGYMDVVALAQLGFANAVATLGTACTADHVQKLFRFTDMVVFSFDGDAAGRRAARRALDAALPLATDTRSAKFLFLPPEHDPDSYIREFGRDAFAKFVSEAMPLSRFLIEAASEGCDLDTIEGRSLLASQARPLVGALPAGALRMQLMQELGNLTEIGGHGLAELWGVGPGATSRPSAPGQPRRRHRAPADSMATSDQGDDGPWPTESDGIATTRRVTHAGASTTRKRNLTRADHAARLLLANTSIWDKLSSEDHQMLASLPAPHDAVFAWLESQFNEHGAQPWAALREAIRGLAFEPLAVRLMDVHNDLGLAEEDEDLDAVMHAIRVDWLKSQEAEALAAGDTSRYRELVARRTALSRKT